MARHEWRTAVTEPAGMIANECGEIFLDHMVGQLAHLFVPPGVEEMLEMASLGAKVLQVRSVELAMVHKVRTFVRSSFDDPKNPTEGTLICDEADIVEQQTVTGIAFSKDEAQISIRRVPDRPGVAAAIFGDSEKVKYVPLTSQQRFTALQSGEVDLLSNNTTLTLTRDTALGFDFTGVNYYDGQGFMVNKKLGVKSAKELNGATVCVQPGTTTELNLADYFRANKMTFKPVIIATQMMESMITNPVPTRAEVSDVANAVLDGTDAVMLSAETAAGKYPLETVQQVSSICQAAEAAELVELDSDFTGQTFTRIDQSIAMGALFTAHHLDAKAIVALTESGSTVLWMSRHRIHIPIYALTTRASTQRKMALYRNVRGLLMDTSTDRDTALAQAETYLKERGIMQTNDVYAITCGEPMGTPGGTNMLKICQVA